MTAHRAFPHVHGERREELREPDVLRAQLDDIVERKNDRCVGTELLHVSGTLLLMSKRAKHEP